MGINNVQEARVRAAKDSAQVAATNVNEGKVQVFNNNVARTSQLEINTKKNKFLKEYFEAAAYAKNVQIPEGVTIEAANINTSQARDIYSGNPLKGIVGISNEKYWSDAADWAKSWVSDDINEKTVEDYCDEKDLTPEQRKNVMQLYYFNNVRLNVFGARIKDMANFFALDKEELVSRVSQMKISDEEKAQILSTKDFLDEYYRVNLKVGDKTYNLLTLTDTEKAELRAKFPNNPRFVNFVEKMQPDLNKLSVEFAQKEMVNEEMSDSGQTSRWLAAPLLGILGYGIYKGVKEGKELKLARAQAQGFVDFINKNPQKGNEILNKCVTKLNKLSQNGTKYLDSGELVGSDVIQRYMKKIGFPGGEFVVKQKATMARGLKCWVNPIKALKNAKGSALMGLIGMIAALSTDDCMGAFKDLFQDQNNFGTKIGLGFMAAGIVGGIASSAAVVPSLDSIVKYRVAENSLRKFNMLPKMGKMANLLRKGKWALLGLPLGLILTTSSSGSSWTSMGLTAWKFDKNGDELVKKNIIKEEDNTFKNSYDNMMQYEAYSGKKEGVTTGVTGDWTIGAIGGVTGAFMSANPLLQNVATVVQGCSETITACAYQLVGGVQRDSKLAKEKQELVASAQTPVANIAENEKAEGKKEKVAI